MCSTKDFNVRVQLPLQKWTVQYDKSRCMTNRTLIVLHNYVRLFIHNSMIMTIQNTRTAWLCIYALPPREIICYNFMWSLDQLRSATSCNSNTSIKTSAVPTSRFSTAGVMCCARNSVPPHFIFYHSNNAPLSIQGSQNHQPNSLCL